jgi:hypothetical protein
LVDGLLLNLPEKTKEAEILGDACVIAVLKSQLLLA